MSYGGLFGDLPTLKKDNDNENDDKNSNNKTKNNDYHYAKNSKKTTTGNKKQSGGLAGALGNAGTSMAFVPTSLVRKRNRPTSLSNDANTTTAAVLEKKTVSRPLTSTTKGVGGADDKTSNETTKKLNFHHVKENLEPSGKFLNPTEVNNNPLSPETNDFDNDDNEYEDDEAVRILHASVTDPYDPMVPNDYLAHRERKKQELHRKELERSARQTLRMQQIMREKIEEERRKVEATGDFAKIAEVRSNPVGRPSSSVGGMESGGGGMGRGRGRGVSNLPAWLIQKQQEQQQQQQKLQQEQDQLQQEEKMETDDKTETTDANANVEVDATQKKRMVVLGNVVAPHEVDGDLADEVREECEDQCGPVESIKVFDANERHPEVRVCVVFQLASDAEHAVGLFHGRSFGGRIISSRLAD